MSTTPARQPAGVPIGGQFAAKSNPECEVELVEGAAVERRYYPDGTVEIEAHRRNGELQDPADGSPAYRSYRRNGSARVESHFQNGELQDPADGSPALRRYRPDGSVAKESHFQNGELQKVAPS